MRTTVHRRWYVAGSRVYPEIPDFLLVVVAHDAEHLQLLRQVRLKVTICVPIKARGRTLGTITIVSAVGPPFSDRSGIGGR